MNSWMITCFSKSFFGIPCPGCGGQRALALLFHGKFSDSLAMYPALVPLMIFGLLLSLSVVYKQAFLATLINLTGVITAVIIGINYLIKLGFIFL